VTVFVALSLLWWSQDPARAASPNPAVLEQIACAPGGLPAPAAASMRVLGGSVHGRIMFGPGDAVIIYAGEHVQRGQQFIVRRPILDASRKQPKAGALYGVHTAGWLTVVDVKDMMAVATVTHACDGILAGDYLEPFAPPVLPGEALAGAPDYGHPGQIVLADERRQTGYPGLVMLMNRGSDHDVRAGQLLTIYRETLGGLGPILDVGRATVLRVSAQSSLIRIDSSREPVYLGDLVAIHRITP
jgi:hypothetical protein